MDGRLPVLRPAGLTDPHPRSTPPPPSLPCGGSVVSASFCESSTRRTSPGAVRVQDALKKSRAGHGGREREAPAAQGRKGHPGEEGTTLAPSLHVHTQQTTCSPTGHRDGTPGHFSRTTDPLSHRGVKQWPSSVHPESPVGAGHHRH